MALENGLVLDSYRLPLFSSDSNAGSPGFGSQLVAVPNSSSSSQSLQLQNVEGRIHKYEGMLSRKTKKSKLKNGWKKRWFRVTPGEYASVQ
jgi:hypothetical protein